MSLNGSKKIAAGFIAGALVTGGIATAVLSSFYVG